MGNQSSSYENKKSLRDTRHNLSHEFTPDLDWEMWRTLLLTGRVVEAKKLKQWLIIKYADYPQLLLRFRKLPEKTMSVSHLPSLNSFHGFDTTLDSLNENETPDFVDLKKISTSTI